jgi:hypothetical protein
MLQSYARIPLGWKHKYVVALMAMLLLWMGVHHSFAGAPQNAVIIW